MSLSRLIYVDGRELHYMLLDLILYLEVLDTIFTDNKKIMLHQSKLAFVC